MTDDLPFDMQTQEMYYKTELDWLQYGQGFWLAIANRSGVVKVIRHVTAKNIKWRGDHYLRTLNQVEQEYRWDGRNWVYELNGETLYLLPIKAPSHLAEFGPGIAHGKVGRYDGNVLRFINIFLNDHFGAGSLNRVYATSATGGANPLAGRDADEIKLFKQYLNRVLRGVDRSKEIHILNGIEFKNIPSELKALQIPEIENTKQEDICVAFEVPRAIIIGDMTNRGDDDNLYKSWMSTVMIPRFDMMTDVINRWLLDLTGWMIVPQPEKLLLFVDDIAKKFEAVASGQQAGINVETASAMVGLVAPEGYTLTGGKINEDAPTVTTTEPEAGAPEQDAKAVTLVKPVALLSSGEYTTLKRWAIKRIKQGRAFSLSQYSPDVLDSRQLKAGWLTAVWSYAVKQIDLGNEEAEAELQAFEDATAELARQLQAGEITEDQYNVLFNAAIVAGMTAIFLAGFGVDSVDELDDEAQEQLQAAIAEQQTFTSGLQEAIVGGALDSEINNRLTMWAVSIAAMYGLGRIMGNPETRFAWRLGATEQHCDTCLGQNGQVRTGSEWMALRAQGIYPQSRSLDCKGYRCDCRYMEV